MTITLLESPEYFDTRGIPAGFDPETLFQYRYDTLKNSSTGLESLLYKFIPLSLIRSVTFAIDPTYRYKIAPATITAVNRTRIRSVNSVLLQRKRTRTISFTSWYQLTNYKGVALCNSPYLEYFYSPNVPPPSTTALTAQTPLRDKIKDTTSRTRIIGSQQGELEFFKSDSVSPSRTSRYVVRNRQNWSGGDLADANCRAVGGVYPGTYGGSDEVWTTTFGPSAATLSQTVLDNLYTTEIAKCKALSAKHAISLLKGVSPFTRAYSLSRNVAELKDIPRSVASLQRTMSDLKKLYASLSSSPKTRDRIFDLSVNASQAIPSEYLSYHFGWKQTWKDLRDLTTLPEKISKKLNLLILRSGKASTFRGKRDEVSGETGVSGYIYDVYDHEWNPSTVTRISRESVTRLVVNATFDFPPINTPHLRQRFFFDQVGLIPRFTDVYNIIPWTWLIDWFTGLGNYIELIEEINHDPSLVNWGLITTNTKGKLTSEFEIITATQNDFYVNNVRVSPYAAENAAQHHTSILEFECQTRQNVASVLDVKRTTEPTSLSGYQFSILGAILAQRVFDTRAGAFRPRS